MAGHVHAHTWCEIGCAGLVLEIVHQQEALARDTMIELGAICLLMQMTRGLRVLPGASPSSKIIWLPSLSRLEVELKLLGQRAADADHHRVVGVLLVVGKELVPVIR